MVLSVCGLLYYSICIFVHQKKREKDMLQKFSLSRNTSGKLPLPLHPVSEVSLREQAEVSDGPPDTLHPQLPRPSHPTETSKTTVDPNLP